MTPDAATLAKRADGGVMYALSLHQPWASFIAAGIKPFETRSWPPPRWLIGNRITIQAAKKSVTADDLEWARRLGVAEVPLGAMLCTAILTGAYQCAREVDGAARIAQALPNSLVRGSIDIDEFGDYSPGRWAFGLAEIKRFDPPIPTRGMQGFWKWELPT